MKRLLAIGGIWFACSVAWMVLGGTLMSRTGEASSPWEVEGLWGPELVQAPLQIRYSVTQTQATIETFFDALGNPHDRTVTKEVSVEIPVPLEATEINAHLDLEHRKRGLAWFATYGLNFDAHYRVENPSTQDQDLALRFPLSDGAVVYDGLTVTRGAAGDEVAVTTEIDDGDLLWSERFAPGEIREYRVRYHSRGMKTWTYRLSDGGQSRTRNFSLALTTDFSKVDFPLRTLSPSEQRQSDGGWEGRWSFDSLLASKDIGLLLPTRPSPGPVAARITFFAPIGLLFFFFVVGVLATAGQVKLHPMHFFLLGCGFFAFHLLFAYLVDHLGIAASFCLASAVSLGLVGSYTRLFTSRSFTLLKVTLPQALYLVLFSFTFFWQGLTGLAITLGAILTLFVMMQITGRIDWKLAPPEIDPDPASPSRG